MTPQATETRKYASSDLIYKKRITSSSSVFYNFYKEHATNPVSKEEWMEMLRVYMTHFFDYLSKGYRYLTPFHIGEFLIVPVGVKGRQIDWASSKLKYQEATGKVWQKGDSLQDYFVYFTKGATLKTTFHLVWDKRGANVRNLRLWNVEMSTRHQWKRLLKKFTDNPSLLERLTKPQYNARFKERIELHSQDDN